MPLPCIQDRVIGEMATTLQFFKDAELRREGREERMLIAMENVAAQGAVLEITSKRVDKHDQDLTEAFGLLRVLDQSTASMSDMEDMKKKVSSLELRNAEKHGQEATKRQGIIFWGGVKQQMAPYALWALFFLFWVVDKYNIVQRLAKLIAEMRR